VLPVWLATGLPHAPLTTSYFLLTTHYSPLTTHHSPLTTHHSPLTTHHSPLTTHCSLLTAHHSLLTTYCSSLLTAPRYSQQSVGSELASLVSTALGVASPTNPKLGVVSPVSLPTRTGTGASEEGRGDEAHCVHLGVISPKRCFQTRAHSRTENTPATHL